jgi:putative nucleotidyltransferase with HDIG domain
MSAIEQLIGEIASLRPMPQIANQILALVEDPEATVAAVAEVIVYDPAITANVLRVCNSAYYALPRRVESVSEAVGYLGLNQIVDMVMMQSSKDNMTRSQTGYGLHEGELWRQAVSSALVAREIAQKLGLAQTPMIFTAALLKDIGKVILDRFVADSFQAIWKLVHTQEMSFREAEKKVIGVDHAEIGSLVAKRWKFSPRMVAMIRNHHMADPGARQDTETAIVYLADTICMMMGIGVGADGLAYRFHEDVLQRLKLNDRDIMEIMAGFSENLQKVEDLIQMV